MDPWSLFARPDCFPHCNCEPMLAGCIICQPWAFWSSAAYLVSATFFWFRTKDWDAEARYWFTALVLVTFTSFWAHASYTNLSFAVDMAGIINLTGFTNFPHFLSPHNMKIHFIKFIFFYIAISAFLFFLPVNWWIYVTVAFFWISAIIFWYKSPVSLHKEKGFLTAMGIYFISFFFFIFDKEAFLCNRPWMPYGHTLWHIGSAYTSYKFARWYFKDKWRKENE